MSTRIATLNIRHGGTRSRDALATRLVAYDADLLVVTEFRANAAGAGLITRLEGAGYSTSHPNAGPKQNTVLIASRRNITRARTFSSDGLDSRHLWCAGNWRDRRVRCLHATAHRQAAILGGADFSGPSE